MLLARRAFSPSASDVARRVRDKAAAGSIHVAVKRVNLRSPSSVSWSRARHITYSAGYSDDIHHTPPSSPATSNYTRKRGRPVTSRRNLFMPKQQDLGMLEQSLLEQSAQSRLVPLLGGQGHTRQASTARHVQPSQYRDSGASTIKANQRMQLWDSSKALRFAPGSCVEADHSTFATPASGSGDRPDVNAQGPMNRSSTKSRSTRSAIELDQAIDHKTIAEQLGMESNTLPDDECASLESTTTKPPSDLDYTPDQDDDHVPEQESDVQPAGEELLEEHVPLAYQIPEDVLRTAMLASENSRASFWSTKLYRGPKGETLSTHYCHTMEVADRVAQYFLKEKVVGFDIEWNPLANNVSIKENASLIQLASENRIALFHISRFPGTNAEQLMPPTLKAVLESPDIYKVGVAVKGDFTRLRNFLGVQAQGVFELSRLHNLVEWYETDPSKVSNRLVGLAVQVLQHLQLPLYKGAPLVDEPDNTSSVRVSNWSLPLDLQQIHYAAADAYAGFRLYHVLEWKRKQLKPAPPAIQLCDYDSKRAPRPKKPQKKTKAVTKAKTTVETATEPTVVTVEQENEEAGDAEDAEGYETAPEEFMDSHQLEDPVPLSSSKTCGTKDDVADHVAPDTRRGTELSGEDERETAQTRKRIGRVNISWLRDPNAGYPVLPREPNNTSGRPSPSQLFDMSSNNAVEKSRSGDISRTELSEMDVTEEDEFADAELEEALSVMEIDQDLPANTEDRSETNVIELSDSNPVELGLQKPKLTTTLTFASLLVPSEEESHTREYSLATTWAQTYLRSTIPSHTSTAPSRIRATVPHLRAYHLWHHQKLSLDEIAKHLRNPPLSNSTVTGYILQAVNCERLEYEKESMRTVVMAMSPGMRMGRWRWIAQKVDVHP